MDEDEEFQIAIALSLSEAQNTGRSAHDAIIVDSDDEGSEDQSRFAGEGNTSKLPLHSGGKHTAEPLLFEPSRATFLSERMQLEKERLERQKRIRPDVLSTNSATEEPPMKRSSILTTAHGATPHFQARSSASVNKSNTVPLGNDLMFWEGELRQTANQHSSPRSDGKPTFRLTEVLGIKSELAFAIISSFALDIAWIYSFFDPTVPVILVAQPPADSGEAGIHNILPNWVKTTPRMRAGYGCMHMKFMLLFYKTGRLRVVVSTANFVDYDYRDIENSIWLQDLPLRDSPIPAASVALDDFPTIMQQVLDAIHVRPALSSILKDHPDLPLKSIGDLRRQWDWSKVTVMLVPTLAGKFEGWNHVTRTGHTRLRKVVRDLKLPLTGKELFIECQGSSIGSYTTQWLNEFHRSARGEGAEPWLDKPFQSRKKQDWPPVQIIFPSLKRVRETVLGPKGGGTMFCRRSQWQAATFPRHLFHDSVSKAGRVLMHSKMIIATLRPPGHGVLLASSGSKTADDEQIKGIDKSEPLIGWAYVGSHNFTPSAWGTLSGSSFNPILNCTNFELGIVIPLRSEAQADQIACFERPARKYVQRSDEPWMQDEHLV